MKFQRGQSIVEFAIILPLFLFLFLGIVYAGFAFSDYLMMSHTARSIAHEASLTTGEDAYQKIVINNTKYAVLKSDLYIWEPDTEAGTNNKYLTVYYDSNQQEVVVVAQATYNTSSSYIARVISSFSKNYGGDSYAAPAINIRYTMYSPAVN